MSDWLTPGKDEIFVVNQGMATDERLAALERHVHDLEMRLRKLEHPTVNRKD